MTDKEYRSARSKVLKIYNSWKNELGLRDWAIRLHFERDVPEESTPFVVLGLTSASWAYKIAEVTFKLENFKDRTDYEIEEIVVHELCHILVCEMRTTVGSRELADEMNRHEERVATQLARAFIWTRDAGRKAKKSKGRKRGKSA